MAVLLISSRYRNKNRKNSRVAPLTLDHEYLTNKPTFMPKEQYDFIQNKKPPMMLPESMVLKYYIHFVIFVLILIGY